MAATEDNVSAPRDEVWVTKDGRRLFVSDMDEAHVKSVLRMLIRNRRRARELASLKYELKTLRAWLDEIDEDSRWGHS
jgi:hypothetical protein